MSFWTLAIILSLSIFPLSAAEETAVHETSVPLFVIERSTNANAVHYEARLRDGKLDPNQPVIAYWVMAQDGRRQELNFVERMKAYGFSVKPDSKPDTYLMTLVSDKKKEIRVVRAGDSVHAQARIGNCDAYLEKIYIAQKKSLLSILPDYAEMIGKDVTTGAECHERVTPADR